MSSMEATADMQIMHHSHGNFGTRPSAQSVPSSPTKQQNTCHQKRRNSQSARQASSGSKVPTSSKATITTQKAPTTPSHQTAISRRVTWASGQGWELLHYGSSERVDQVQGFPGATCGIGRASDQPSDGQ